jgi:sugar transferase (PEP-CTERM system associated)
MINAFIQGTNRRSIALVGCETIFIIAVVTLSAYLVVGNQPGLSTPSTVWKSVLIAFVCQLCMYYADLYEFGRTVNRRDLMARILNAVGASALLLAALYFVFPVLIIGRGVGALTASSAVAVALGWRLTFVWLTRSIARQRLLIIGASATALDLARELQERQELGVEIVGFIIPNRDDSTDVPASSILGTIDDIPAIVRQRSVDRVVVSLTDARGKLPMGTLLKMKLDGVSFDHLASVYETYTGKIAVENLRPSWLIFAEGFRKSRRRAFVKRAIDVVGGVVALVILSPLMAIVAAAVKLTSDGPVLYHQDRVGQNGTIFRVHKFRSMRNDAESATGPVWASKTDSRITPIGRFLRRTRLDELPQLWNIVSGDMSIVGPRPERPEFVTTLSEQIPFYALRHIVKPGLSGWAQVRFTYGASVEDSMEKLQYDLYYIKHLSIALDVSVMVETVKTVILRRGN